MLRSGHGRCLISLRHVSDASGRVYGHGAGGTPTFWVRVQDEMRPADTSRIMKMAYYQKVLQPDENVKYIGGCIVWYTGMQWPSVF
jgi:hypothetical protein